MAREVVKTELTNSDGFQRRFVCAAGVEILKGTILKFADPRTASAGNATGDLFAGIAAMDKDADDDSTSISVYTDGIGEMVASGAIPIGSYVKIAAPGNYVMATTAADAAIASTAIIVGYALEAATDEETIGVRFKA